MQGWCLTPLSLFSPLRDFTPVNSTTASNLSPLLASFIPDVEQPFTVTVTVRDTCPTTSTTFASWSTVVSFDSGQCSMQANSGAVTTNYTVNGVVSGAPTFTAPFVDRLVRFNKTYNFAAFFTPTATNAANSVYVSTIPSILPPTVGAGAVPYCFNANNCPSSYANGALTLGGSTLAFFNLGATSAGADLSMGATVSFMVGAVDPVGATAVVAIGCTPYPASGYLPLDPAAANITYFASTSNLDFNQQRNITVPPSCAVTNSVLVFYGLPQFYSATVQSSTSGTTLAVNNMVIITHPPNLKYATPSCTVVGAMTLSGSPATAAPYVEWRSLECVCVCVMLITPGLCCLLVACVCVSWWLRVIDTTGQVTWQTLAASGLNATNAASFTSALAPTPVTFVVSEPSRPWWVSGERGATCVLSTPVVSIQQTCPSWTLGFVGTPPSRYNVSTRSWSPAKGVLSITTPGIVPPSVAGVNVVFQVRSHPHITCIVCGETLFWLCSVAVCCVCVCVCGLGPRVAHVDWSWCGWWLPPCRSRALRPPPC